MRSVSMSVLPEPVRSELNRLGQLLKGIRLARRLSQADLAARLRTSVATLQRLETGSPGTSLGTFLAVLWMLDAGMPSRTLERDLTLMDLPKRYRARRSQGTDQGLDV